MASKAKTLTFLRVLIYQVEKSLDEHLEARDHPCGLAGAMDELYTMETVLLDAITNGKAIQCSNCKKEIVEP